MMQVFAFSSLFGGTGKSNTAQDKFDIVQSYVPPGQALDFYKDLKAFFSGLLARSSFCVSWFDIISAINMFS